MSFSINFTARTVAGARSKLRETYAPEAVKAVVKLAIASIREPLQGGVSAQAGASSGQGANARNAETARSPQLIAITVEACGHIDESGGRSNIDRFIVQPLYD